MTDIHEAPWLACSCPQKLRVFSSFKPRSTFFSTSCLQAGQLYHFDSLSCAAIASTSDGLFRGPVPIVTKKFRMLVKPEGTDANYDDIIEIRSSSKLKTIFAMTTAFYRFSRVKLILFTVFRLSFASA